MFSILLVNFNLLRRWDKYENEHVLVYQVDSTLLDCITEYCGLLNVQRQLVMDYDDSFHVSLNDSLRLVVVLLVSSLLCYCTTSYYNAPPRPAQS